MKYNGTTVPNYRDDTYNKDEVHRKTSEELYDTAFNEDQQKVLDNFEPSGGGSLPDVTSDDNGDVLTVVDGEWDKGDPGYGSTEGIVVRTEQSVTTQSYEGTAHGYFYYDGKKYLEDELFITFDNTEYTCPRVADIDGYGSPGYGAAVVDGVYDWSDYPFSISIDSSNYLGGLTTPEAGTYSIKIEANGIITETSESFDRSVRAVLGDPEPFRITFYDDATNYVRTITANKTLQDLQRYQDTNSKPSVWHPVPCIITIIKSSNHVEQEPYTVYGTMLQYSAGPSQLTPSSFINGAIFTTHSEIELLNYDDQEQPGIIYSTRSYLLTADSITEKFLKFVIPICTS